MRILLVNDYDTPTGGAELLTLSLREGLRRRGHDARLFATSARSPDAVSHADYECRGSLSASRLLLQTANPWAAASLCQVLAEFRPEVVHVKLFLTQLSPLILPPLRGVPALLHAAWYRTICPTGLKMLPDGRECHSPTGLVCLREGCVSFPDWALLSLQMRLWRRWRDAFRLIVANSDAVRARLLAEGIAPVEVVWNGVPVRPPRPPLDSPPAVTFAGRLVPEKGVHVLLEAFAAITRRIPRARLLVAGDGPERSRLQSLATTLQVTGQVHFLGHIPRDEQEQRFASGWVHAVPSVWPEPFGIVTTEAMMRGTAVVASRTGGLAEIVEDARTGLLVPPGDPAALAAALLGILSSRERAEALGAAGRARALLYVDRFVELYGRLCQNERQSDAAL